MEQEALYTPIQELEVSSPQEVVIYTHEPLRVPPSQEIVQYGSPDNDRIQMLREYLSQIGEEKREPEIKLDKPLDYYKRTDLTKEQRRWIKQVRDENLDLAPYPHVEHGGREAHHIWAQGFLQSYLGLANNPELVNHPHNLITLSENSHRGPYIPGVNESRHPDVHSAIRNLQFNPDAMRSVFADHMRLAKEGVKYWVSHQDSEMTRIATERTEKMRELKRKAGEKHGKR